MTAGTLYEAVEPHAMWKELLQVMVSDIVAAQDRADVSLRSSGICEIPHLRCFHTRIFVWSSIF